MQSYELDFLLGDFSLCCHLRFPENLSRDGETTSFFTGEVRSDEIAISAAKVVDTICAILTDVNPTVGIRDFVDDIHNAFNLQAHWPQWSTAQSKL